MFKKTLLIVLSIILISLSTVYSDDLKKLNKNTNEFELKNNTKTTKNINEKDNMIYNIKNAKTTDNMYLISDYIITDDIKDFFKDTINLNLKTKLLNKDIKLEEKTRLVILLNKNLNTKDDYNFLNKYLKNKDNILIIFNINNNILSYLGINSKENIIKKNATKIEYKDEYEFLREKKFGYINNNLFNEYKKIGIINEYEQIYDLAYIKENVIIINYFSKDSKIIASIIKDNIFKIDKIKQNKSKKNMSKGEMITTVFILLIVVFNIALIIIMIVYRMRYKNDLFK